MKKHGFIFLFITLMPLVASGQYDCAHSEQREIVQIADQIKHPVTKAMYRKPKNHTGEEFQNVPRTEDADSAGIAFYLRRFWHSIFLHKVPEQHSMPEKDAMKLRKAIIGDSVTWLGHATFLINISGKIGLTDPFLSTFASPLTWCGPKRMLPAGISLDKLPPLDFIVISHNHFDHLDDKSIRNIPNKKTIQVIVPLGLKPFFEERGYKNIAELDWNDKITLGNLQFISVPAIHHSGRSFGDRNKTLWSSWVIAGSEKKVLFVGDSAYSKAMFKKIGSKHGPIQYAILPIGAYEPREVMKTHHMNPEEAIIAGKDVRAEILIASHWGTINLSDEPPWEPPGRFYKAGVGNGMTENDIWVMKIGETRAL